MCIEGMLDAWTYMFSVIPQHVEVVCAVNLSKTEHMKLAIRVKIYNFVNNLVSLRKARWNLHILPNFLHHLTF